MDYYNEIKNELIDNEINKQVKDFSKNKYELQKYYNVGKLLIEAQGGEEKAKYGNGLIKEYSKKLTLELGKGYSISNLKNMRSFYLVFSKSQAMTDLLSWSHYVELLVLNDINEIIYYINITKTYNLGYRQLREKIKNKEYERLPEDTRNKLIANDEIKIEDFVKNPIIIKRINNDEEVSEKILQKLILEDINNFLEELGEGFCYIKNEYKIKLGNRYGYIDLLLYNIKFKCYVIEQLKVTELKAEHTGQIQKYMNYIDENIKTVEENKTIGIIICK